MLGVLDPKISAPIAVAILHRFHRIQRNVNSRIANSVHRNLKPRRISRHRTLLELVQVAHSHAYIVLFILVRLAHQSCSSTE